MKRLLKKVRDKSKYIYKSSYRAIKSGTEKYFLNNPVIPQPSSGIAVIMHVYYLDNLPLFRKMLNNLTINYDLFVTLPTDKTEYQEKIIEYFPSAIILLVPNKGRDVLPFVKTTNLLKNKGYIALLKFHSKKSTHRTDGQDWLEDMLDKLLPTNKVVMDAIIEKINNPQTGIIGPTGVYYPLTINFPANGRHMTEVIKRLYGKKKAYKLLQLDRKKYGFFGGTMFWARIDAIESLLDVTTADFEKEKGQIDGTFAHALERLFCLVPEIENRNIYEVSSTDMLARKYESSNIPAWSKDHDK